MTWLSEQGRGPSREEHSWQGDQCAYCVRGIARRGEHGSGGVSEGTLSDILRLTAPH